MKKVNPFNLAYEQYQMLQKKFGSTGDAKEKQILTKRLTNLLAVMEFLSTFNKMQ